MLSTDKSEGTTTERPTVDIFTINSRETSCRIVYFFGAMRWRRCGRAYGAPEEGLLYTVLCLIKYNITNVYMM